MVATAPGRSTALRSEVVSTPGIQGGMPCVSGTRIPASQIWFLMRRGHTEAEIFEGYPTLPQGALEAVRDWAIFEPELAMEGG